MKEIAIITAGLLPVPAVRGGAVESLIDYIINENENVNKLKITVFSIYDNDVLVLQKKYKNTTIEYIKINKTIEVICRIISKIIYKLTNRKVNLNKLYINKVCKALKGNIFDQVILENRSDFVLHVKRATKAKVVLHIHNDYLNLETKKGKEIVRNCDKVITVSEYIKKRVLTLGKEYIDKVFVLKNCTDTSSFNKELYSNFRTEFRRKNNILKDDIVIMFSGRIHETKGVKELILAFKEIKDNNIRLLIVGSSWYGSNEKTKYAKDIEVLTSEIKDKIIFTGFIPFSKMPQIHAVSDITVVPSIWEEPAGLVVIEAMSSGLPLITTDSGGIPEYINKECVTMVKRDEHLIKNLTYLLDELINDKNKRELMGKSARQYVLQYNTKQYYYDFLEILGV